MTTDDAPDFDRPPLIATLTRPAYRWENPTRHDRVHSIAVHVDEEFHVTDDRQAVTEAALTSALLQVTLYVHPQHRAVEVPLTLELADAITDAMDAFRALHHLHVELAARRATLGKPAPEGAPSVLVVADEGREIGDAAVKAERFAASWDAPLPAFDGTRERVADGWISGANAEGKAGSWEEPGSVTGEPGCICRFDCSDPKGCRLHRVQLHTHGLQCQVHHASPSYTRDGTDPAPRTTGENVREHLRVAGRGEGCVCVVHCGVGAGEDRCSLDNFAPHLHDGSACSVHPDAPVES